MDESYWEEEYDEELSFQKVKHKPAKKYRKPQPKDKKQIIRNQQKYKENEKKSLLNGKDF